MTLQIVILAMIAAFLGLRLYAVLGRRAEHEEEIIQGHYEARPSAAPLAPQASDHQAQALLPHDLPGGLPAVEQALREIMAADRRFDSLAFLQGAQGAYRMVLEAFWRGDKEQLSHLCDSDVYAGFVAAIDARIAAGEVLENRLVRVDAATIVAATFDAPVARITVRFTADIAAVTRDAAGQVIAGSLTDAIEARDLWTFSRDMQSAQPDWLLDETDED
ncbi:MAG: hypothetical protein RLZZ136_1697 [Pseudomonadota bacterium]